MSSGPSIAIETSCRRGGVALGRGDELLQAVAFDASSRHATVLVSRLDELLRSAGHKPRELEEAYVSVGPGSFTGVRVGVTVARTLAQVVSGLRLVAVPTPLAIAENLREREWERLGVILDAREGIVHASLLARSGEKTEIVSTAVVSPREFLASAPRPLLLIGEGLFFHKPEDFHAEGVEIALPGDLDSHLPTAEGVWRVGRRLAAEGRFTEAARLLPVYARPPEAIRLWERRHRSSPSRGCAPARGQGA